MRRIFTHGPIPVAAACLGLLACANELAPSDPDGNVSQEVATIGAGDAGADGTSSDARSEAGVDAGCPELRAFPGAEGFGAFTPGGRGGRVIEVTNLEHNGPGSLQEALDATGPRIVVFRVGGTIETTRPIRVREPYVTIAGQTAPGDGIAIRGAALSIGTHDVIVRGMRIRVGDDPAGPHGDSRDGLAIVNKTEPPHDIIVDHSSVSWAIDENIAVWYPAHDITVQWSITSEALHDSLHSKGPHSKGLLIGPGGHRISIHHNLLAHNASRNPLFSDDTSSEIVNNVIYNWGNVATRLSNCHSNTPSFSNVIGNHFRPGRSTTSDWSIRIGDCWADGKVFVQGNIGPRRPTDTGDDWLLVNNVAGDKVYSDIPAVDSTGLTGQGADGAYDLVLSHAGAIVPARDPVDERIIQSVRDGTGSVINSQSDVGGWPTLANGMPPRDEDHDGIPDRWERAHGLNPNDPADASETTACGYTWIEEYVNSLIPMPSGSDSPGW